VSAPADTPVFLTRAQLQRRWGLSRSTTYQMQRSGYLPSPVRLGGGAPRWPLAEIIHIEERALADRGAGGGKS
jgi:predicted DNA-binding transcriptional regulator AlpA